MTDPLVPPPEHAHLRWHFIIVPYREDPEPKEWINNAWQHNRMHATPVATARAGWRYHGPCDPSAVTLNPDTIATRILNEVMELSDRTSPDDWPEAMLVTGEELVAIVKGVLGEVRR